MFELMKDDNSDPFENALETKAITGQIVLINMCMGALGLFGLCSAFVSYQLEYEEDFGLRLQYLLCSVSKNTF